MKLFTFSKKELSIAKRALCFVKQYKVKFILGIFCMILGIILILIQPVLLAKLLTTLFSQQYSQILFIILLLLSLYLIQATISFCQSYLFSHLNENIIYDLKINVFSKILNLSVKSFDNMPNGTFIARIHDDTAAIASIITNQLVNVVVDLLKAIAISIIVFSISPVLALITLIAFPITNFIFSKFGKILRERNMQSKIFSDDYLSVTQESIASIREIKTLGIKDKIFNKFLKLSSNMKDLNINMNVLGSLSSNIAMLVGFLSNISILAVGAYLISRNILKMELFIAFTSYSQMFTNSLTSVTKMNLTVQQAFVSLERIFSIIDELDSHEIFGEEDIKNIEGSISFKDVTFSYDNMNQIINGISFDIKPHRKYAIVGASGVGKTTIFNLILRLYDQTTGTIQVDGIDIKQLSEMCIRKNISIVRQEPILFNLSIRENLLLVNPYATSEEIQNACKAAYIHDFIIGLQDKYDTILTDGGANLSGGQKQRLAVARALLKGSKIILFDEATSSLDMESQCYLRKSINELIPNHTVIIIAHGLSNLIDADEILVLEKGKLVGMANHGNLMKTNNVYKRFYMDEIEAINSAMPENINNY